MGGSGGRCPGNGVCAEWALKYMDYCLCSLKDGFSLSLGMVSVLTWTVAEIPQIITNYKQKSTHGLSITFLTTWIVGDIFNVVGCMMEPATLPTQYYMAVLYTMITMVLFSQAIYYNYIYPRLERRRQTKQDSIPIQAERDEKLAKITEKAGSEPDYYTKISHKSDKTVKGEFLNSPINIPFSRDLYYLSARSLTKSCTPPLGSLLAQRITSSASRQPQNILEEPLLATQASAKSVRAPSVKPMLSVVTAISFLGAVANLCSSFQRNSNPGYVIHVGRKMLQDNGGFTENFGIASLFGWGMAAIYMGGRFPQIFLTMKKGNAEGLNPLMFLFALIGNATYVGSILLNSLDWSDLRPNLPWLVDAGGCVLLDGFILLQFLYIHYRRSKARDNQYPSLV